MSKICLIKQPAGLGDIFFCQKIAKVFRENTDYKQIIWPVSSIYSYLNRYMGEEGLFFCSEDEDFEYKEIYLSSQMNIIRTEKLLYLPLESACYVMKSCKCHQDPLSMGPMKYDLCSLPYVDWLEFFTLRRDREREKKFVERIGLDLSIPYNLINNHYGTFPHFVRRDLPRPPNGYRNIHMDFYEGANLFDWSYVFENAAEIHTMDTSATYLLHRLGLERVTVYSRFPQGHCPCFTKLFNPKWNFLT